MPLGMTAEAEQGGCGALYKVGLPRGLFRLIAGVYKLYKL